MSIKIMLDVDSTLYNAEHCFREAAESIGLSWFKSKDCWITPDDETFKITQADLDSIFELAHSDEWIKKTVPYSGCTEALFDLTEEFSDVELYYVSSRMLKNKEPLIRWLDFHDFPFRDNCHVCGEDTGYSKTGWMRENKPRIVVDDRVRTLIVARFEFGAYCYSLIHPWNANLKNNEVDGIYLFKNWKEMGTAISATVDMLEITEGEGVT